MFYRARADLRHRYSIVKAKVGYRARTLLDLGGFSTGIHKILKSQISESSISVNRPLASKTSKPDIVGDLTTRLFPDKSFDVVLLVDVLEHLPPELREHALDLATSYSKKLLIVTYPFSSIENDTLEREFIRSFGREAHPSIADHIKIGLPSWNEFDRYFDGRGSLAKSFHTCNQTLFQGLRDQVSEPDEGFRHQISARMNLRLDEREPLALRSQAYRCCVRVKLS